MNLFFVYEEYGAKYELMIKDIAVVSRSMPEWEKYQKGLEALAATLAPSNGHNSPSKKALTLSDLMVKARCRIKSNTDSPSLICIGSPSSGFAGIRCSLLSSSSIHQSVIAQFPIWKSKVL
jgi:hypothetical protein